MLGLLLTQLQSLAPLAQRWKFDAPHVIVAGAGRHFSGLALTARDTLLVVDDHGALFEFASEGKPLRELALEGKPDLEDVCIDDSGASAWLAVENTCELIQVDLDAWREVGRRAAAKVVPRDKKGVEALCFANAPDGTRELWLGHQGEEKIFALALPGSGDGELAWRRTLDIGDEMRAIAFDAASGAWLCAAEDKHQLVLVNASGERIDVVPFVMPPNTVEGLALGRDGSLYACADGGDVVHFERQNKAETASAAQPMLKHLLTLDVPSLAPEIVAVSADDCLLCYIDASWNTLEIGALDLAAKTPTWTPFDLDDKRTGAQGVPLAATPTSVATHPKLPIAFVAVVGKAAEDRGLVEALDLRRETLGRELWTQTLGRHPDSVAISRDGRWLVAANEGEGDDRASAAPGTVSVIDLAGVDVLAFRNTQGALKSHELDVWQDIASDAGTVEPEFVAIDPQSRFAVVTCQENDAAIVIDLRGDAPHVGPAKLRLPAGSQPDGAAVLDDYVDAKLGRGALVALAEEGKLDRSGRWLGQCISFHWLGPEPSFERTELLGRVDVAELLHSKNHRACPEGVVLARRGKRILALLGVERADVAMLFDATDPRAAVELALAPTGKRPEGMLLFEHAGRSFVVTADEGKPGPGEITFSELVEPP